MLHDYPCDLHTVSSLVDDIRSATYLVNNIFVLCFLFYFVVLCFFFVFCCFFFPENKIVMQKKHYVSDLESIETVKCSNQHSSQNISWYNGSTGVKIKPGGRIELNGLSLKIKNVQLDDAGTYECRTVFSTRFYTIYVNCECSLCSGYCHIGIVFVTSTLKAGFHMIADDRGSQIADRRKFCDRLRSYGNTLLRSPAIACDPAIVIADDRRR